MPLLKLTVVLAGVLLARGAAAQDPPEALPEYVLKAGFLFNFAKYVEWPADAFENPESPIVIGISGKDPFGADLEKALQNKTVRNRAFRVVRFAEPADIRRCHMLFVPRTERERVPEILTQAARWSTLTVGEEAGFARSGGATSILIENEKPRIEVNPDAAEKVGLTINAKLLKAATIVRTAK